jgi:predicted TIM-barrel fold metal-dependent hydrolase
MVAVALGCNGLSRSFGEPAYHAIYEAADELGLPIVIQVGSDIAADQATPPVANGVPSTYGEFRAHGPQSHWSHACSLITEGVFTRFPKLKVLLVGGGATWVVPWAWRMDYCYKTVAAAYPWIERLPSEYVVDNIRVSTLSLEKPAQPERLAEALGAMDGIERTLVYTGGYPSEDWETPEQVAGRLPPEWHDRVFRANAEELFRWPARVEGLTHQPVGGH